MKESEQRKLKATAALHKGWTGTGKISNVVRTEDGVEVLVVGPGAVGAAGGPRLWRVVFSVEDFDALLARARRPLRGHKVRVTPGRTLELVD